MNNTLKNLFAKLSYFKNKRIIVAICILLILFVSLFAYLIFFSNSKTDQNIMYGTVYIDGQPAPFGTNVSLVFPNGIVKDEDGTNETGVYEIDVTDFIGESFEVHIVNGGEIYVGTDEMGTKINMSLSGNKSVCLDVFVVTTSSTDDENGNDNGSDDEDNTNDTGEDNGDEDSSDDTNDSDNDSNDDDDPDDDNPSDDDPPDEDEDEENDSSYLFIKKTVWSRIDAEWKNNESVEIGGNVQFNITVTYNGSNLSEIHIIDRLPEGLEYTSNATVNGNVTEPVVNQTNNSLQWNIPAVSDENITLFIQYNTTALIRSTLQNNVTATILKNDTAFIEKHSNATVYVFGDLIVSKTVRNTTETSWHETVSVDVGEIVRFNISVIYNGSYSVLDINIQDKLPNGFTYLGNATLNGQETIPTITDGNQTLMWNISTMIPNETIFIEFDVNITINATIANTVKVQGNESLGKQFIESCSAAVTGIEPQKFICNKTVKKQNNSWENSIHAYVGDIASFNVTITNIEMATVYGLTVIDTIPSSLLYIENTSMIFFKNQTYYQEPKYSNQTNSYYWIDLNTLIEGYFLPNDTLTIHYNVSIIGEGVSVNRVNVSSSLCGSCDPLTGSDSAVINATIPVPELSVDLIIPENVYVGMYVEINSIVSGGNPPYTYEWDLDSDSIFDDANTSIVVMKWEDVGNYSICLHVTDNSSENVTISTVVNVTIEPLSVNAGGPYYETQNELIHFNGSASGGIGNYTWFWDFNDGNVSTIQNPSHAFSQVKTYIVKLSVTDERNITVNDTASIYINMPDEEPPIISIDSPINAIYYKNRALFPFFTPFILGAIDINVTAEDADSSVDRIELYINDMLVHSTTSSTMSYNWDENVFGKQVISIKAFDSNGNQQFIEKKVLKFF